MATGADPCGFSRAAAELGWRADGIEVADGFRRRLIGLMDTRAAGPATVLGLPRCASVHTCFMTVPIDVAFLDASGRVLRVEERMRPWRMASCPGAAAVLERLSPQGQGNPSGGPVMRGSE